MRNKNSKTNKNVEVKVENNWVVFLTEKDETGRLHPFTKTNQTN